MGTAFELLVCGSIILILTAVVAFCIFLGWHMKNIKQIEKGGFDEA